MARSSRFNISKAAWNGAVVGPFIILLNLYFDGQLAKLGFAEIMMTVLGGVLGGAFLFVTIACLARFAGGRAK